VRFQHDELLLRCNDRLQAPNTPEAYEALSQHLTPLLATLYPGQQVAVEHQRDDASRLTVAIKAPGAADVEALLERLSAV
jgi:hypothetical protein